MFYKKLNTSELIFEPRGTDGQHPGPQWHDWIAREFQKQDKEKI